MQRLEKLIPTPQKLSADLVELNIEGANLSLGRVSYQEGLCSEVEYASKYIKGMDVTLVIDPTLKNEEYKLVIKGESSIVSAGDKAGVFYGLQTIRQIQVLTINSPIKSLYIHDWPEFKVRGFYHDVTRGKVPTLETLNELADRMSYYKLNQLQLYVEHTFAFEGFEEMWKDADPLTADEITQLDSYCKSLHIDLVPSLSTFGHLYHLLTSPSFSHLSELDVSKMEPFNWPDRMAHHTLDASNPESLEVVCKMLDQYIPLFSSNLFNICCDETFDLGKGKTKDLAERVGTHRIYIDFVKKVMDYVRDKGKQPMFWGDIILEHPEYINEIPKDTILLNWDYNEKPDEDKVRIVQQSGLRQYLCPGLQGWNRFVNEIKKSYNNISAMANYGVKYKAEGILNTDWGDFGHINMLACSIPGMIIGAWLSWHPKSDPGFKTMAEAISWLEYGDSTHSIVILLDEISKNAMGEWGSLVFWELKKNRGYVHPWYNDKVFNRSLLSVMGAGYRAASLCENLEHILRKSKRINKKDVEELICAAKGVELFNRLLSVIIGNTIEEDKAHLKSAFDKWMDGYSNSWLVRNKPSELYRIQEFIDTLLS